MGWLGRVLLCVVLATFYVAGARMHARTVNRMKSRGDQTGYLIDAENVYANWHGRTPPALVGERNRMPVYAGVLALFYSPAISDQAFFERAQQVNICLSLLLLGGIWLVASHYLSPHPAANLTGVAAFGWFIFKAGYAQSELLFYTFFFFAFLACWQLFRERASEGRLITAAAAGLLCGIAHLTKAAMLPFVGLVLAVGSAWSLAPWLSRTRGAGVHTDAAPRRAMSVALVAIGFLLVVWPYISTSKRVFGHYFYNVNSTFYAWYDNWPRASVGTALHGDGQHWPDMPAAELPGPGRYLREHSVAQIAERMSGGFRDMGTVLRRDFDLLPYLTLYLGMLAVLLATRRRALAAMARDHRWTVLFLALYGVTYLLATAFYHPISGTGTGRFLLAHALPLFFILSRTLDSARFTSTRWQVAGFRPGVEGFHWLVSAVLLFNVGVRVWPRLMQTYGGF